MSFTEARLEQAIIDLLQEQGFPHYVPHPTLSRSSQEVLIKDNLREFSQRQCSSQGITDSEIDSIICGIEFLPRNDLYRSTKAVMEMIYGGFLLKGEDRKQKELYIYLLDYEVIHAPIREKVDSVIRSEGPPLYYVDRNIYKLVNQLEIAGNDRG